MVGGPSPKAMGLQCKEGGVVRGCGPCVHRVFPDRQVSQDLREALEASAAESRSQARALEAQEQGLLQMQRRLHDTETRLNWSQAALRESWRLGNIIQGRLQEKEAMLATATGKRWEAEEALNATLAKACAGELTSVPCCCWGGGWEPLCMWSWVTHYLAGQGGGGTLVSWKTAPEGGILVGILLTCEKGSPV